METSCREPLLPPLCVSRVTAHGHGRCREGVVPSGLRTPTKWPTVSKAGERETGAKINYSKLRELCKHVTDCDSTDSASSHEMFISNHRLLLQPEPPDRGTTSTSKPSPVHISSTKRHRHTCSDPLQQSHDVGSYVEAIHGCTHTTGTLPQAESNIMQSRLTNIHSILKKLPLQRNAKEMNQLAHHLSHFPSLFPEKTTPTILMGVAYRCFLEDIPNGGFSLPDKGGVYLILKGCVEKKVKAELTQQIHSSLLYKGDHFGKMEENFVIKSRYPMYVTSSACALMRITVFDYQRVLQNCQASDMRERIALISSCPVLRGISTAVISALATDIHWEIIPANTILLNEAETIERVGYIQSGHCKASMQVPHTRTKAQLVIGEPGPGSCVGEGLVRGTAEQPYSVTTTTRVRIGWVSSTVIRMNEVKKLIPANRELSIPVPSKDMLREKYAQQLMQHHWKKIKNDILSEVRCGQSQSNPSQWK